MPVKATKKFMGELFLEEGLITRENLQEALKIKEEKGGFLGEILVQRGHISEEQLINLLVRQCRIPYLSLSSFQPKVEIAKALEEDFCQKYWVLPLDKLGNLLTVGMVDPLDEEALEALKKKTGLKIKPVLCTWKDIEKFHGILYPEVNKAKKEPSKEKHKKSLKHFPYMPIQKYTFGNLIVPKNNPLPFSLAFSVASSKDADLNPFIINGTSGVGKTHLANAIGNEVLSKNASSKVVYITAGRFCEDLARVSSSGEQNFLGTFEDAALFIMDDIQFLSGREKAQESFINLFRSLYKQGRQIVGVSDSPIRKIESLDNRLMMLLETGVTASLEPVDLNTRFEIINKFLMEVGTKLSEEIIYYLVEQFPTNLRLLEGALKKLVAYSKLMGYEINIDLAEEVVNYYLKESPIKEEVTRTDGSTGP